MDIHLFFEVAYFAHAYLEAKSVGGIGKLEAEARLAAVRMAQLQLIRSAHTLGAGACMCGIHINVCKCMRPAAAPRRRSQYCDIKRNMADEMDIFDKSRHLQMLCSHSSAFNSVFE